MALFDWILGRKTTSPRRAEPEITQAIPSGSYRFIALDVETANADVGSICQIGLACVSHSGIITTYATLVDPRTRFAQFNTELHGIDSAAVRNAPMFREAIANILPLLYEHQLVQHSSFDKRAIAAACVSCGIPAPRLKWLDSVQIARRAWPELRQNGGHGLANLKKVLDLDFQHHDAGEDARAAAMVVLHAETSTGLTLDEFRPKKTAKQYPSNPTRSANPKGALHGEVAVFTGNLEISRSDAANLAASIGMEVKASVTLKATYLIVGDQDLTLLAGHKKSSKHRKAEDLISKGQAIKIIGETAFLELVIEARQK